MPGGPDDDFDIPIKDVQEQGLESGLKSERSVSCLGDRGGRTSNTDQKLTKFRFDVLVASVHKEFDVLDDLQHRAASIERLGGHSRSIAVVNTVVSPLEDHPKSILELIIRFFACLVLLGIAHGEIIYRRNAEESDRRIWPRDPRVEKIAEKLVAFSEEFIEKRLNGRELDDVLSLHHLAGRHPPSPIRIIILFQDGSEWELDLVNPRR